MGYFSYFRWMVLSAASVTCVAIPTLEDMAGDWIDLNHQLSLHVNSSNIDLPIISNFHGSVGTAPAGSWDQNHGARGYHKDGVRPVDLFAINSLEIPPFAGCGHSPAHGTPYGCGRLLVDGAQVPASTIRYQADMASRRSGVTPSELVVNSQTRMMFEQPGILWMINFTNTNAKAAKSANIQLELTSMINEYAHLSWVLPVPFDPSNFTFTSLQGSLHGVLSTGKPELETPSVRPAVSAFVIIGDTPKITIPDSDSGVPRADFDHFIVDPASTRSIRVALTMGSNATAAKVLAASVAESPTQFDIKWASDHTSWEHRWQSAFNATDTYFSGAMPTLELSDKQNSKETSKNVMRVYYTSVLSILSQMRTNLQHMYDKVFPTSQGNNEPLKEGGVMIGGAVTYYWDEALSSFSLALLEPRGRPPTYQAWLTSDLRGKKHNWFDLDCINNPIGTVYGPCNFTGAAPPPPPSLGNVYPYNIWSYGFSMFNHISVNNDSTFLESRAANSDMSVDQALEEIVLDWQDAVINGSHLVNYNDSLDGFSDTYRHVMPGMQGNNIWMLRQLAQLRQLQGNSTAAANFKAEADAMARETIHAMLATSADGVTAWWNVLWPVNTSESTLSALQSHEMRHVVDFFSLAFGMCGINGVDCDLNSAQRAQLSNLFHSELKTSDWIRATSPKCNCSNNFMLPTDPSTPLSVMIQPQHGNNDEWPGLVTCSAAREDHGTTGAYTAWPALAAEALCYIENNCSSAFSVFGSYASNTYQGPFGQANAVPQLLDPPYTPFNGERAFKPCDRRYLNMAVGAFADGIIRGLFGYHPPPLWPTNFSKQALDSTIIKKSSNRGFDGSLSNLHTPFGLATITSDSFGLQIALQD